MKTYIVLYRVEAIMSPCDAPFSFACQAEDEDHAEEQMMNAEPDADIVWVYEGGEWDPTKPKQEQFDEQMRAGEAAYDDYWGLDYEGELK
jgi:hypothetical protein